eukprot:jgi/Botrbrau1/4294/Bobra.0390s0034.2
MGRQRWPLLVSLIPLCFVSRGKADMCYDTFASGQPQPRASTPGWTEWHQHLVGEAQASGKQLPGADLVVWGDSVVEQLRGTGMGKTVYTISGAAPFNASLGWLNPLVLAISGDYTVNLQWRLNNGEMPARPPKVALIYIGSNDLSSADCNNTAEGVSVAVPGIVSRVQGIVATLRTAYPDMHIVLMGLMPRGAKFWLGDQDPYERWIWPNRYTPALQAVNAAYQAIAAADPTHVTYLYCGDPYAEPTGIRRDRLIDGIHPTEEGMQLLVDCIAPVINALAVAAGATGSPKAASAVSQDVWHNTYSAEEQASDAQVLAMLLSGPVSGDLSSFSSLGLPLQGRK